MAIQYSEKSINVQNNTNARDVLGWSYYNLGLQSGYSNSYVNDSGEKSIGYYNQAVDNCSEAIDLDNANADAKTGLYSTYNALGYLYDCKNNSSMAIEFCNKSIAIQDNSYARNILGWSYYNLGLQSGYSNSYVNDSGEKSIGYYNQAVDNFSHALDLDNANADAKTGLYSTYNALGYLYDCKNNSSMAIEFCNKSIAIQDNSYARNILSLINNNEYK